MGPVRALRKWSLSPQEPLGNTQFILTREEIGINRFDPLGGGRRSAVADNLFIRIRQIQSQQDSRRIDAGADLFLSKRLESQHALIEKHMARVHLDQKIRAMVNSVAIDKGQMEQGAEHAFGLDVLIHGEP